MHGDGKKHKIYQGATIGRLTLEELIINPPDTTRRWLCRCACGNRKVVLERYLRRGDAKSCGCLLKYRLDGCRKKDCRYHSDSGCSYFLVNGHTRTALHEDEGVDINNPCREYAPGENPLRHLQPFTLNKDLL